MKTKLTMLIAVLALSAGTVTAAPLGTAFTYQGRLNDGGNPATGIFDLRFTIYDAGGGGNAVGGPITNSPVGVTNGLFTTTLDFGAGVFTGDARWLEIGVRTNGGGAFTTLGPRQALLSAPYAVYAPSAGMASSASNLLGTLPGGQLSGTYSNAVNLNHANNTYAGTFSGNGSGLIHLNAANLTSGSVPGDRLSGIYSNAVTFNNSGNSFAGMFNGNGGPLTNLHAGYLSHGFLGSDRLWGSYSNVVIFNNRTNSFTGDGSGLTNLNAAALMSGLIPNGRLTGTYSAPLIFANPNNRYTGKFIGDGAGLTNFYYTFTGTNFAGDGFNLTGLNANNIAFGQVADELLSTNVALQGASVNFGSAVINSNIVANGEVRSMGGVVAAGDVSGARLSIGSSPVLLGTFSSIAGGADSSITGGHSFIGGGQDNSISGDYSFIGSGQYNYLPFSDYCVIGGGYQNQILSNDWCSAIGGGELNFIHPGGDYSVIAGGYYNSIESGNSAIGGGVANAVNSGADFSTIGGGTENTVRANAEGSTIPGGANNEAGGYYSFAAGYRAHALNNGTFVWADWAEQDFTSTGPNQFLIRASGNVGINTNNPQSLLHVNGAVRATVFEGDGSHLTGIAAGSSTNAVTLGGHYASEFATSGHKHNAADITDGKLSCDRLPDDVTVVHDISASRLNIGGQHNLSGSACIVGGAWNTNNSDWATICAGWNNIIRAGSAASFIGGGANNSITNNATMAAIVNGWENTAGGYCSFAGGYHAQALHGGTFVWADWQNPYFPSTGEDQFLIRACGGVGINTNHPRAMLHVNGDAMVNVLTITGGADIAEPFTLSGDEIPDGAVVVIDETNPGHLKLSGNAYDTKVAGIVSGANGVNPGISLSQAGLAAGGRNVALSGRVYALADAANGPIKPGDLLTTSTRAGHAMKVTDHAKAQGAILGKAMSRLDRGSGMVLVLVSLQ